MTWAGFLGLTFSVGMIVGGALLGLRWVLDRLHPAPQSQEPLSQAWEMKFQAMKERIDEIELARGFRGKGREEL